MRADFEFPPAEGSAASPDRRPRRRPVAAIGSVLALGAVGAALLFACRGEPGGASARVARGETTPQRVVVLSPAAAEMMAALDLEPRIVGVGDFGPWPPGLGQLPRVGGYDSPNLERILELQCDLLVTSRSEAFLQAEQRLEELGLQVAGLDTSTYDGIYASLRRLGELFARGEQARRVEDRMRSELARIETRTRGLSRRAVLVVVGHEPLFVAGPGSHVDEMIRLAGGRNVAHDAASPYARVSLESVLERLPEVIVDASDNRPAAPRGRVAGSWSTFPFLPAVTEDRVFWVHPGRLLIPGMRLGRMTGLMARMIHPEEFGAPLPHELNERGESAARERRFATTR